MIYSAICSLRLEDAYHSTENRTLTDCQATKNTGTDRFTKPVKSSMKEKC